MTQFASKSPPGDLVAPTSTPDASDEASKAGVVMLARKLLNAFFQKDERSLARRNAVVAFSVRVTSAGLLYLMQIALARWMGTFEYGIYVFAWTWVLVLGGLSPLGLNIIAMRLVPEYRETSALGRLKGFVNGSRLAAFSVGTSVALLG
ncbi:MAG: oligosaccharide flippase family protein, partial [Pseudomonadota bacterium]